MSSTPKVNALRLTGGQMRLLWHIKHTLALVDSDSDKLPVEFRKWAALVKVSTLQLQDILYNVVDSEKYNPYREDRVIVYNTDRRALR